MRLRRTVAAVAASGVAALGITVSDVGNASADTAATAATCTTSAQYGECGPYDTEGWEDAAAGGPYRMDCSGFVSMAWGLPTSLATSALPQVSTVTDADISEDKNLNQGDASD